MSAHRRGGVGRALSVAPVVEAPGEAALREASTAAFTALANRSSISLPGVMPYLSRLGVAGDGPSPARSPA